MVDFTDRRQRKAWRAHLCCYCGHEIVPGQTYIRTCYSENGRVNTRHAHVHCDALSIAYAKATGNHEGSGLYVESWIRGTVCHQCAYADSCTDDPFGCSAVLDEAIKDECLRRAINEA